MSGGGGGVIIIHSKAREVVNLDVVKDRLSVARRQRLEDILAKNDGDWTAEEFHFVLRCISNAYDDQC